MVWTAFDDTHSGGSQKLEWESIYIEADRETAIAYFADRFGRDPRGEACECCGPDYSIDETDDLLKETGYARDCVQIENAQNKDEWRYLEPGEEMPEGWVVGSWGMGGSGITLDEYRQQPSVLFISKEEM